MTNRISQVVGEVLVAGTPKARVSQNVAEILYAGTPHARVSQIAVEVLVVNPVQPKPALPLVLQRRRYLMLTQADDPDEQNLSRAVRRHNPPVIPPAVVGRSSAFLIIIT